MKTSKVTVSRGSITWYANYDEEVPESVIVFNVDDVFECAMSTDGYEYSGSDIDLVTGKELATFNTEDSEELIQEIIASHDKLDWLWEL